MGGGAGIMIEEKISPTIVTAMRSMYQTKAGRLTLMLPTTQLLMKEGTQVAGQHEDDPKSVEKIPKFIKVRGSSKPAPGPLPCLCAPCAAAARTAIMIARRPRWFGTRTVRARGVGFGEKSD
jgi:hypothetical protein